MPQAPPTAELLHAVLALQLGLISLEEAQMAIDACGAGSAKRVGEALVDSQRLSPAQDQLVTKLVEAYLTSEQDDAERSLALLEQMSAAREVLSLPDSHHDEATVAFDGSKTAPRKPPSQVEPGLRITSAGERFRQLKLHAAGGVGEVLLARDEQLRRDVALKQLQEKFADDAGKRQRFVLEGEVTGALEHPGIVPVYAMGVDAQGRPFYAMRFVRGESFRKATQRWHSSEPARRRYRRDSLELRRLLARFISVCQAIEYAHNRGVVHRDVKPANIMLGKFGETYVVDWGMARVLNATSADPSVDGEEMLQTAHLSGSGDTQFGSVFGTPAYMSPEQAAGRVSDVGPRSDVYSLGATLYYLLAGQAPFSTEGDNPLSFVRKVTEGRFPMPRSVIPSVPRELEAICLAAMAVQPDDRYQTPAALAADVERWLADDTVAACRPTAVERFTRWGRKHRTAVVAGGAALLLVSVVSAIAAVAVNRARLNEQRTAARNLELANAEAAARDEADRRFLKARETVDSWLTGYSTALQNVPGAAPVRMRMLELAAREYETFVAEKNDDPAVQLEHGRTLLRLGSIYRLLGRHEDSLQRIGEAHTALEAATEYAGVREDAALSAGFAYGLEALAHADLNDLPQAEKAFQSGIDYLTAASKAGADVANAEGDEFRAALVTLHVNRGGVRASTGDLEGAEADFTRAVAEGEALVRARPADLRRGATLATARLGAGQVQFARGDARGAAKSFGEAVDFFAAASQIDAQDLSHQRSVAQGGLHLATALRRLGDVPGERKAHLASIAALKTLVALQAEVPSLRLDLALSQLELAQLHLDQFEASQAEPILREAIQGLEQLADQHGNVPSYMEALAAARDSLARALLATGRADEALTTVETAIEALRSLAADWPDVPPYRERLAVAEATAAQALLAAGRSEESRQRFLTAVELLDGVETGDSRTVGQRQTTAMVHARLGEALWTHDKPIASEHFARARQEWNAILAASDDQQFTAGAAWFLATCLDPDQKDAARGIELAAALAPLTQANLRYRLTHALSLAVAGRTDDALQALAAKVDETPFAEPVLGNVEAICLHDQGQHEAAVAAWKKAADWTEKHLPLHGELALLRRISAERMGIPDERATLTPAGTDP